MTPTTYGTADWSNRRLLSTLVLGLLMGACGSDDPAPAGGSAPDRVGDGGSNDGGAAPSRPGVSTIGGGGASSGGFASVIGTGGGSSASTVLLPTVTVRVLGSGRLPVADAQVSLGGQIDVTDGDGFAEFTDVSAPYAAMVGAEGHVYGFAGLYNDAPVFHVQAESDANRGALTGTPSGLASFATTPGARLQHEVVFAADAERITENPTGADFALQTRWRQASRGVVRAIQYEYDASGPLGGYPLNFLVFGATDVDADAQDVTLPLAPILQSQIDGTISMPAAAIPERVCLQLLFEDGANLEFERLTAERDAFSYQVPALDGAEARFAWYVTYPNFARAYLIEPVSQGAQPAVSVPLPLELSAPADGATDVRPGTQIAFSDSGTGVHVVQMYSETTWTAPRITLYLDGEQAVLPDLAEVGLVLPPEAEYRWTAWSLRGVETVDELVDRADYGGDIGCGNPSPTRIRTAITGPWRTFTTRAQ